MIGGLGNDTIDGNDGNDTLLGNDGNDQLIGKLGDDRLEGNAGNDELVGGTGFDVLVGGAGNDHLFGDTNPEVLDGTGRVTGGQGDIMLGGDGNDIYHVDSPLDFVDEGYVFASAGFGGVDSIESTSDFFWDVYGIGETIMIMEGARDPENDGTTIIGGVFNNELIGNSKTNVMFGRGGSDIYRAGDGIDFISLSLLGVPETLYAGVNGSNTIVVEKRAKGAPPSYDIVFEFESGKDKLDVSNYGYKSVAEVMALGVDDLLGNSYFALGDGLDYLYMVRLTTSQLSVGDFIV
jgi:Ca2+-binding RTX toxin-like protein